MLDQKLLGILVCPVCKGDLHYDKPAQELICLPDALAFPIKDDVPVMLSGEAREMTLDETEQYR
ncbi:MAG: Trm112 family protein [Gammaproteobacteria bacterium]